MIIFFFFSMAICASLFAIPIVGFRHFDEKDEYNSIDDNTRVTLIVIHIIIIHNSCFGFFCSITITFILDTILEY